jgi:nucleotide-binding universal stress UspA family protein
VINRILVPLDGSELAESVLPLSCYLAEQFQATLILFHVVEKSAPSEIHGQTHLQNAGEARGYLDRLVQEFSSEQVKILQDVHEVQEESVARTISSHTKELQSDMVVLCAHGRSGLRDVLFGNIAQQVIRQVAVPVLFIRPEWVKASTAKPITHILLPLDGSKPHEASIPFGSYIATKCHAKMHLVTVVPTPGNLPGKEVIVSRFFPSMQTVSLDLSAQQAEDYLYNIAQDLSSQEVAVAEIVRRGDIASNLVKIIETEQINLIIIATHGQNLFDAQWVGSLTPKLLSKTYVPVVLIHVSGPE